MAQPDFLGYHEHHSTGVGRMSLVGVVMGRPKGRPKSSVRQDVSTKFDKALLGMARLIATASGASLAEYISEAARSTIERDYAKLMRRLEEKRGGEGVVNDE